MRPAVLSVGLVLGENQPATSTGEKFDPVGPAPSLVRDNRSMNGHELADDHFLCADCKDASGTNEDRPKRADHSAALALVTRTTAI